MRSDTKENMDMMFLTGVSTHTLSLKNHRLLGSLAHEGEV